MAELPALGSHCSWAECGRLDFLPLLCHACGALYCRHHVAPDQHQCSAAAAPAPTLSSSSSSALAVTAPSVSQQHQATRLTSGGSGQRCHVAECGSPLVAAATALATRCDQCGRPVCLAHRHADQHGCVAAVPPGGSTRGNLSPQQQQQQLPPAPPQQQLVIRPVSELSPLAARVQLMRAKKHALCATAAAARGRHQPVPASEDRLYLFVAPPSGSGGEDSTAIANYCPVFVGRQWSLGRALDGIAAVCGVANNNNNTSSSGGGTGELCLVRARDQCRLDSVASFSVSVAKLCQDGWLSDGEFVQLQLC